MILGLGSGGGDLGYPGDWSRIISRTDLSEQLELEELLSFAATSIFGISSSEFDDGKMEADLARVELLDVEDLDLVPDFGVTLLAVKGFLFIVGDLLDDWLEEVFAFGEAISFLGVFADDAFETEVIGVLLLV